MILKFKKSLIIILIHICTVINNVNVFFPLPLIKKRERTVQKVATVDLLYIKMRLKPVFDSKYHALCVC